MIRRLINIFIIAFVILVCLLFAYVTSPKIPSPTLVPHANASNLSIAQTGYSEGTCKGKKCKLFAFSISNKGNGIFKVEPNGCEIGGKSFALLEPNQSVNLSCWEDTLIQNNQSITVSDYQYPGISIKIKLPISQFTIPTKQPEF